ncbi:unnamed protein product [Paramecium sonneborni]|uniref:Uncharacterized protein n=1 Tax=Paramecium sonneborni TaxID=65129 RepID=A0A8S1LKG1_9CILI|nr:unnamed protein product [Paramecium sonneborni]
MRYKFLKPNKRVISYNRNQVQQMLIICVLAIFVSLTFLILSQSNNLEYNPNDYIVIRKIERDNKVHLETQGLHFLNCSYLVESCGQNENSEIHYVNLELQTTIKNRVILDDIYQVQGVDVIDGKIFHLTRREKMIFLRDIETLEELENRKLNLDIKESRGISHSYNKNNTLEIYITDGTDKIFILDSDLLLKQIIKVQFNNGSSVQSLSEIEFANEVLYASTDLYPIILAINLTDGYVKNYYDFSQLIDFSLDKVISSFVCGIAYKQEDDLFWISGKNWPFFWEVELN